MLPVCYDQAPNVVFWLIENLFFWAWFVGLCWLAYHTIIYLIDEIRWRRR